MTSRGALAGRTIVVTRAAEQAAGFVALLEAEGATVVQTPTIAIEPPPSWAPLDAALDALASFAWVVFTSVNGVAMVDHRLGERRQAWTAMAGARVAAIGPATAAALGERGLRVEIVPEDYRAEGLVEHLRDRVRAGDRVLLPRAARTRDLLVEELRRLGADVREVAAYTTRRVEAAGPRLREALAAGVVDAVTFTSSSTARHFAELLTEAERRRWLPGVVVASIGPITAATAAEYGLTTHVMPREYTIPALARALVEHFAQAGPGRPPAAARSG
ncbi:MAG: uroporphyrinogen-III synthase [Candidatus Rokuibacteriota bacterium]